MTTQLTFQQVSPDNWRDLEQLFEEKGGPHPCWCMVWRPLKDRNAGKAFKKQSLKNMVDRKTPIGLLAYDGSTPVAWCSVAPRTTYRNLSGNTDLSNVWSLVCFFVRKSHRGLGLISQFSKEAISYAKANGAEYLEAYPVDPESPSYRFMGLRPTFEELGFVFHQKAGKRRNVMSIRL